MVKHEDEEGITEKEQKLIEQLRERVQDELPKNIQSMTKEDQDLYLVRWLRARDLHLDNATKMLRNSLEWRKERDADNAMNITIDPFFNKTFPYSVAGQAKKGQPVLLVPMSEWDFRKVVNNSEMLEKFDDWVTHFFETICNRLREEHLKRNDGGHPPITQFLILMDTKSYPYGQLLSFGAMKKLLQVAATYEAHYPEILFRGIFINCPSYFNMFITLLKPVIAPKTLGKLTCYSQMKDWQKDMEKLVDPAIIPERYGGTAKDV